LPRSSSQKRLWIEPEHAELSIRRQCELLDLERSTYYYQLAAETAENLALMRAIDKEYTQHPFFGSRRLAKELRVNRKRVQRLMRIMGLEAVGPKPRTTRWAKEQKIHPYLLRKVQITRRDQVWSMDITYIPPGRGYLYLTAVLDWYSRYVLAWRLSPTLEGTFCLEALDEALRISQPEIFNTDQGSQFTSAAFTSRLEERGIAISMDGRGRALDNAFIERLWRTVKYEEVYLQEYEDGQEAQPSLKRYWRLYNQPRRHQSLGYRTPAAVYFGQAESREDRRRRVTARL
jgi:putative transposase